MNEAILETSRLSLSEFTDEDCEFILKLVNTEGWLKYIGDKNIKNNIQALHYLQNGPIKSYKLHGFGL